MGVLPLVARSAQKGVDTSNLTGVPVNLLGGKLESAYRRGARSEGDEGI